MIIGISGWERSVKTGLGAILASNPEEFNSIFREYHIRQGFGNLHLFKTPYPWNYVTNTELVRLIRDANKNRITDTLFFVDEVENVYHPRDYTSKEQTENLKGIGQHAKLGDVYLYTFQQGKPEDSLLGPDKILRSNTRIDIEIDEYNPARDYVRLIVRNYMVKARPGSKKPMITYPVIRKVSQYFSLWDYLEPVV